MSLSPAAAATAAIKAMQSLLICQWIKDKGNTIIAPLLHYKLLDSLF